jgi:RimJ/RimL family protein N-acetyltransferase
MIYGERIRLRGIERQDLPTFVGWINDPEVLEGIGIIQPFSQAEEDHWFEEMLQHPASEHVLGIEVRLPAQPAGLPDEEVTQPAPGEDSWKLIGSCGFISIDWRNRSSEFGINIGEKSYWNQGYGTEAVRLLVQHGFHTLNLHRIFLRVFETNRRAIRAYEKAGFTLEGRQRQAEFRRGKYIDVLVMSILQDEF